MSKESVLLSMTMNQSKSNLFPVLVGFSICLVLNLNGENPKITIPARVVTPPEFSWTEADQKLPRISYGQSVRMDQKYSITKGKYVPQYYEGESPPPERELDGSFTGNTSGNPLRINLSKTYHPQRDPTKPKSVEFEGEFTYTDPATGRTMPENAGDRKKEKENQVNFRTGGVRGNRGGGPEEGGSGGGAGGGGGGGGDDGRWEGSNFHSFTPPFVYQGDSDCDGVNDELEQELGLNRLKPDTDDDGLPDGYELDESLDPLTANNTSLDKDLDGLSLAKEFEYGSNFSSPDGDGVDLYSPGDLIPDDWEIKQGTDPRVHDGDSESYAGRTGDTNLSNYLNREAVAHSDEDGLSDHAESLWGTDPNIEDTDEDGISDRIEVSYGFDPIKHDSVHNDSDKDSLNDVAEVSYRQFGVSARLSPIDSDSDWDGIPDDWEVSSVEYNPLTRQNNLIYWLRLDRYQWSQGSNARLFNSAFAYENSMAIDGYVHGNFGFENNDFMRRFVLRMGGGDGSYVTVPESSHLLDRDQATCGIHVLLQQNKCSPVQRLLYKDGDIDIVRRADGKIAASLVNAAGVVTNLVSTNVVQFEQWWHLAFKIQPQGAGGDRLFTLFINGVSETSTVIAGGFRNSVWPFQIGSPNSVSRLSPKGLFSDFRFYGGQLSDAELTIWADFLNPNREENKDPDGDLIPNWLEFESGSDPCDYHHDTDGDGRTDYEEIKGNVKSLPYRIDSDGDGLSDLAEVVTWLTDPMLADTDGDRLLDSEEGELLYLNSQGAQGHPNPLVADTDGDGLSDFMEIRYQRNPLIPDSPDIDGDGVSNLAEIQTGTDPLYAPGSGPDTDSDGDGLSNYEEVNIYGTDPNKAYTFGDGVNDESDEINDFDRVAFGLIGPMGDINSNPAFGASSDFDGDGIFNIDEVKSSTNPLLKSNMVANLVRPQVLKEIQEISETQAKNEGTEFLWGSGGRKVLIPDNATATLLDASGIASGWIVLNSLELTGSKSDGDDAKHVIKYSGNETKPGWKHVGQSPASAFQRIAPVDLSDFINSLERDENGYVTIGVRSLATHPVKPDPNVPDGDTPFPNLFGQASNGHYGGFGLGGLGEGGSGGVGPWVDVWEELRALFGEGSAAEHEKPFPVYGSTSVDLKVIAVDIDARSAGDSGPFIEESKENVSAAIVSPTVLTSIPVNLESGAAIRIYPTGVVGGARRLQWSSGLNLFHNGAFIERTAQGFLIPEEEGKVEMRVFSDVSSPTGGTISLTGLDPAGASIGTDSVSFTDVPVAVGVFPDEVTYISADTPSDTILFSVETLEENPESGAWEVTPVQDGTVLGIKVRTGEAGAWQDKGEIQSESGIATYTIQTSTHDKDTYYVKAYVKSITRAGGSTLTFGDTAKDLGETSEDPANRHSGLISFSKRIQVVPGLPVTPNFDLTPPEYPADGESELVVKASPTDAFGNTLRPGTTVTWSMTGFGQLKESDSEIAQDGTTNATLISKEKRTDDFYQTVYLETSNPQPFAQPVGNLRMSGSVASASTDVVIGGGPVEVEATFTAAGESTSLKDLPVIWYCSNGKYTFNDASNKLDADGKARIWVTGNGANVGTGMVYAQAGTASAKVILNFKVSPGTVSFRIADPLLAAYAGGTDRKTLSGIEYGRVTQVVVTGPPGGRIAVGFDDVSAMDYGSQWSPAHSGSSQSGNFRIFGLNPAGEITLNQEGKAEIGVLAMPLPAQDPNAEFAPLSQIALVGRVTWVPPGAGEISSFHVTPGRIVSMPEQVLVGVRDVLRGFVWGDSQNLAQASGEIALALIPWGGAIGDCRDMLRELCRGIWPGDDDPDWRNFSLALVSLIADIIPGGGTASSAAIAPAKVALTMIKNLSVPITAVAIYGNELQEFMGIVSRSIGYYLSQAYDTGLTDLARFIEENGILEILGYLQYELENGGLMAKRSPALYGPGGQQLYLVSTTGVAGRAMRGLSHLGKDAKGILDLGRALRGLEPVKLNVASILTPKLRNNVARHLTQISADMTDAGRRTGTVAARKMISVLMSERLPDELVIMLENAHPNDLAKFLGHMATVFVKTGLSHDEVLKILQMKYIYDSAGLVSAASPATVMTLGKLMEDMATVATRHGTEGSNVISGLTKYADGAVDAKGNIDNSYWDFFGPIIHGRRAEIEYLAKNEDAVPGTNVVFRTTPRGGKIVSDVDAFLDGAAISIKRQGKTLDEWARPGAKSDAWLKKYFAKVRRGGGKLPASATLEFWTGKELPSATTQERLREIAAKVRPAMTLDFKTFDLLPPPNIN